MRVGLFIPRTPPNVGGGFTFEDEVYQALLRNAAESEHHFVLFVPAGIEIRSPQRNVEFVPVRSIPFHKILTASKRLSNRFFGDVLQLPSPFRYEAWIDRWIERHHVDVFWNLNSFSLTTMTPYIVVVWDVQVRLQPWFPELNVDGRWERWTRRFAHVLRRATWVIAGTEAGRKEIEFFFQVPRDRIVILPHPTPSFALHAKESAPDALARFRLERPFLFYPAQFWSHKNHGSLLRALRISRDELRLNLDLVFTGSDQGNETYVRKTVHDLGLDEYVHFLGFVSRDELVALYRKAIALVYLSLFGPENLPPLEAFALGCPVIAAAVSGAEEQLDGAALLVDGLDARAIADAIRSVFHDHTLRKTLICAGRERAARFTGDDFVRGVFRLLDRFHAVRQNWSDRDSHRPSYPLKKLFW